MSDWKKGEDGMWRRTVNGIEESTSENPNVTQGARDAADKAGINIAEVEGTGKDGAVTKADVDAHGAQQPV